MNDLERDLRELFERVAEDARPAPRERMPETVHRRARRRATRTVAVSLLSVAALAGAGMLGLRVLGDLPTPPDVERPAQPAPEHTSVFIPGVPADIAIGASALWVANSDSGGVFKIDPETLQTLGQQTGQLVAIDAGRDSVWVGGNQGGLFRVHPETLEFSLTGTGNVGGYVGGVSVGPDLVWVWSGETVQAVDPETSELKQSVRGLPFADGLRVTHGLAADRVGGAWLAEAGFGDEAGGVIHIRPDGTTSRLVLERGPNPQGAYAAVAWAGGDFIYVCCDGSGRIARIDPAAERIVDYPVHAPGEEGGLSVPVMTADDRFVYSTGTEGVYQLDPETGTARLVLKLGDEDHAYAMTADSETLWVIISEDSYARRNLVRVELAPETAPRPLPPPEPKNNTSESGLSPVSVPRSGRVESSVPYVFDTGHCGLSYLTDFDGSFWDPEGPNPANGPPAVFNNPDRGTMTLVGPNEARFKSSTGEEVTLRRHQGPMIRYACD